MKYTTQAIACAAAGAWRNSEMVRKVNTAESYADK